MIIFKVELIFTANIGQCDCGWGDAATDWRVTSEREKLGQGPHHENKPLTPKGTEIGRYRSQTAGKSLSFQE